mgnify:CR=1 FL=1
MRAHRRIRQTSRSIGEHVPESPKMAKRYWKSVLLLLVSISFALSPLLSGGFNGFAPDRFPIAQIDPPAQPAGYAFAIWGLIYLWLLVSAGYGVLRRAPDRHWNRMRGGLIVSLAIGAAWIPVAQISPLASTVMIWLMTGAAILALLRAPAELPWLGSIPVGLYAGWLTVAANVALALVLAGYGVIDPQVAALICLTLAMIIALAVLTLRPISRGYAAAVIWALIGVCAANIGNGDEDGNIAVLALCALAIGLISARLSMAPKPPSNGAAWAARRG